MFSAETIRGMDATDSDEGKLRHESAERVYAVAKAISGIETPGALAAVLGETPQTVTNWGTRGVSERGALAAQRVFGCDANWILTGQGAVLAGWPLSPELLTAVRLLDQPDLLQLENVMRAHVGGMSSITLTELQATSLAQELPPGVAIQRSEPVLRRRAR